MNGRTHSGRAWTVIWVPHTKGSAILLHVEIAIGPLGPSMGPSARSVVRARRPKWEAFVHLERKGGGMLLRLDDKGLAVNVDKAIRTGRVLGPLPSGRGG